MYSNFKFNKKLILFFNISILNINKNLSTVNNFDTNIKEKDDEQSKFETINKNIKPYGILIILTIEIIDKTISIYKFFFIKKNEDTAKIVSNIKKSDEVW